MALPKLETPIYELVLPSTGEKIKYRPFLVKEQKNLMVAQEGGSEKDLSLIMGELIKNCTFGKLNPDNAPIFDIEYVFLKLRTKSIGETSEVSVLCPDDAKTRVQMKVNLEDVEVQMTAEHTNEVMLTDKIKLVLRYPILKDMSGVGDLSKESEAIFKFLNKCIHEIHDGEKIYNRVDMNNKELDEFIDQMSSEQLTEVTQFFTTMPRLRHVVEVTNPITKVKSEVVVEGLINFLD